MKHLWLCALLLLSGCYNTMRAMGNTGGYQPRSSVVEGQINGTFRCWRGETLFPLTNGQVWQQSAAGVKSCYRVRPRVMIYRVAVGYAMQVEGVDGSVRVRRIR